MIRGKGLCLYLVRNILNIVQSVLYCHTIILKFTFRKMINSKIIAVDVQDIRFPTSLNQDGSDAMVLIIKKFDMFAVSSLF